MKMVLVSDLSDREEPTEVRQSDWSMEQGTEGQAAKEEVVRKLIEHLKKDV